MNSAPKILILGAGISGLGLALALQKHCPSYTIEIFEIRPEPASIGGAVGLTPNAIRYLDHLDVLSRIEPQSCEVSSIEIYALRTASKLSDLDFNDVKRWQFRARRVKRGTLLKTLLDKVEESGLRVQYGKRASAVEQTDKGVHVSFEDETVAHGDVLVGADGIHSFVRMTAIQPDRTANYTGIATAYGFVDTDKLSGRLPFTSTGMYSGRKGSIMMSYHDLERKKLYVGAVMETAAPSESEGQSLERQGWKSKSSDKEEVRSDILERFGGSPEPLIDEVIEGVEEWYLYPVYKLAPRGVWSRGRCIIVGDAAHAVSRPIAVTSHND
jgi:2-polyprenyl-6-methoxyphenol hydroxylase-like FAD-dependent oxidoreductase